MQFCIMPGVPMWDVASRTSWLPARVNHNWRAALQNAFLPWPVYETYNEQCNETYMIIASAGYRVREARAPGSDAAEAHQESALCGRGARRAQAGRPPRPQLLLGEPGG